MIAPGIEPDLDDSAKTSIIFSFLGRPGFTKLITKHFDSAKCLKTYRAERNPSVSANCNALLSIVLDTEEYQSKNVVIIKVTNFICDSRSDASGALGDKWVVSTLAGSTVSLKLTLSLESVCFLSSNADSSVHDRVTPRMGRRKVL